MDFVPLLAMSAFVKKVVDMVKFLAAGDVNAIVTQLVAWVAGIAAVFIAAKSDFGSQMVINQSALSSLNNWALAFTGLVLASIAGVGWDTISAIDSTNSANTPRLIRPTAPVAQPVAQPVAPPVTQPVTQPVVQRPPTT
jgi:hypothetical protein